MQAVLSVLNDPGNFKKSLICHHLIHHSFTAPSPATHSPTLTRSSSSSSVALPSPSLPLPSPIQPALSDAEDVDAASSTDPASASASEAEDAAEDRLQAPSSSSSLSPQPPRQPDFQKQQRLKSQVATLSNALAAITSEKNKMESSFQADKRRAKEEKDELTAALAAEKSAREAEVNAVKAQVNEFKAKIRSESLLIFLSASLFRCMFLTVSPFVGLSV